MTNLFKGVTRSRNDNTTTIVALLAGVAVGAILGVLFAPDSGTETRNSIGGSLKDFGSNLADKAKTGAGSLNNLKDKAVDAVKSRFASNGNEEIAQTTYS